MTPLTRPRAASHLFNGMAATMKFNKDVMEKSAKNGFTNATDAADYLVNHGVPFRDAHSIVGRLVLYCIDKELRHRGSVH